MPCPHPTHVVPCAAMFIGAILLAATHEASAQEPRQRLDDALRLYAQGDTASARTALQNIIGEGTTLPADVRQASLAYLGDILFSEEGSEAAHPFFSALLAESPDYVMDPFEHPEPVCEYFEALRAERTSPGNPPIVTTPRARAPWMSLVPGGVYWFGTGKVGTGIAVAATQAGLLTANLILLTDRRDDPRFSEDDTEAQAAWEAGRLAQNLTAGGFYLSLVLPPAIEFSRWSAETPRASVAIGPGSLLVTGTF